MMKTIETKEQDFDSQLKTRHQTQPRVTGKHFGFTSDYSSSIKQEESGPYIFNQT